MHTIAQYKSLECASCFYRKLSSSSYLLSTRRLCSSDFQQHSSASCCLPAGEQSGSMAAFARTSFFCFIPEVSLDVALLPSPHSCGSWPCCRGLSQAVWCLHRRSFVLLGKQPTWTWNVVIDIGLSIKNRCVRRGRIINMKLMRRFPWALCIYLPDGFLSVCYFVSLREDRDQRNILLALLASTALYRIYNSHVLKGN